MLLIWNICFVIESLSSLPDISKWNTQNVTTMSWMFYNCISLSSLPDISQWNNQNVTTMTGIFFKDEHPSKIPEIVVTF